MAVASGAGDLVACLGLSKGRRQDRLPHTSAGSKAGGSQDWLPHYLHNLDKTADSPGKMTCESCGAPMRLDRDRNLMVCEYCQREAVPPMDEEGVQIVGETTKTCPGCTSKLCDGVMESQPLLYCAQCHGMLISMEKFVPLVDHLRSLRDHPAAFVPARGQDTERNLHCPLCDRVMDDHPYGGPGNVNIDTCEGCSVLWLDRGELLRITVAPDSHPLYSDYESFGESNTN